MCSSCVQSQLSEALDAFSYAASLAREQREIEHICLYEKGTAEEAREREAERKRGGVQENGGYIVIHQVCSHCDRLDQLPPAQVCRSSALFHSVSTPQKLVSVLSISLSPGGSTPSIEALLV